MSQPTSVACPIHYEMEKNPAYEFISISTARTSISDSKIDVLQPANIARPKRCKISGQTCISAIFAVVAILALAGMGVTLIVRSQKGRYMHVYCMWD